MLITGIYMTIETIIQEAKVNHSNNKQLFYAHIALKILERTDIFSLIEGISDIKQSLQKTIKDEHIEDKPKLYKEKHNTSLDLKAFDQSLALHRRILSCPTSDEHVILLACLRLLEEEGIETHYKTVLRKFW